MTSEEKLRPKQYLRHLLTVCGLSAGALAKKAQLPPGESVEFWTRKIANIRAENSGSRMTQETANVLAPALGTTPELMMNPPADFVPGSDNGQPATPVKKMTEADLIKARSRALYEVATQMKKTAFSLAEDLAENAAGVQSLTTMVSAWIDEETNDELVPLYFAQLMFDQKMIKSILNILIELTAEEEEELGHVEVARLARGDDATPKKPREDKKSNAPKASAEPKASRKPREETTGTPSATTVPVSGSVSGMLGKVPFTLTRKQFAELFATTGLETVVDDDDMVSFSFTATMPLADFFRKYLS